MCLLMAGFMFPGPVDPARVVGVISLVVLAIAILAFYVYHVAGAWRWMAVSGVMSPRGAVWMSLFIPLSVAALGPRCMT
jgi:hypothetical protein